MRIFYIAYRNDYSNRWEKIRLNPYCDMWYGPLLALAKERGHEIRPFWIDEEILSKGRAGMNSALRDAILAEKPDISLFYGGEGDFDKKILAKIKENSKTITVYTCGDDSWSFDLRSRHFAPFFTWVVTLGYPPAIERYHKIGCKNVIFTQVGVDFDIYHPVPGPKDIDVSFVGTWSKAREEVANAVRRAGIDLVVKGAGWPGGSVSTEEMIKTFSRSKIVLSMNTSAFTVTPKALLRLFFRRANLGEGGAPFKLDILNFLDNFRSWWQKRILTTKGRNFEVAACRTMQVMQYVPGLEAIYTPEKEIVTYEGTDGLIEKLRYYLAHPEEREAIAQNAYDRTVREHGIKKRILDIFSAIGHPL